MFGELLSGAWNWASDNPTETITALAALGSLFGGDNGQGDYGIGGDFDAQVEKYFKDNLNATVGVKIGNSPTIQVPTRASRQLMDTITRGTVTSGLQSGGPLGQAADIVGLGTSLAGLFGGVNEGAGKSNLTDQLSYADVLLQNVGNSGLSSGGSVFGGKSVFDTSNSPFVSQLVKDNPDLAQMIGLSR